MDDIFENEFYSYFTEQSDYVLGGQNYQPVWDIENEKWDTTIFKFTYHPGSPYFSEKSVNRLVNFLKTKRVTPDKYIELCRNFYRKFENF